MSTHCECPAAGYCTRHQTRKSKHWHDLCQTRHDYFSAWEQGHGPGQLPAKGRRTARRVRISQRAAQRRRLIEWLTFFRTPGEAGLGDTLARFRAIATGRQIDDHMRQLQKICSCKRQEATEYLNDKYPYRATGTIASANPDA